MLDERLERNWKMANAASDHVMRPPNKQYRANYDQIVWTKKRPAKPEPPKQEPCPQ